MLTWTHGFFSRPLGFAGWRKDAAKRDVVTSSFLLRIITITGFQTGSGQMLLICRSATNTIHVVVCLSMRIVCHEYHVCCHKNHTCCHMLPHVATCCHMLP